MRHHPTALRSRVPTAFRRVGSWGVDLTTYYFSLKLGGFLGAFLALMMANDPAISDAQLQEIAVAGWHVGLIYWALGFGIVHYVLVQGLFGMTLGKWLFGLRLVAGDANAGEAAHPPGVMKTLLRSALFPVSLFPLGFGFLHGLVDRGGQGWHDLVSGTFVLSQKTLVVDSAPSQIASDAVSSSQAA